MWSTGATNFTQHTRPIIIANQYQEGDFGIYNAYHVKASHLLHDTCVFWSYNFYFYFIFLIQNTLSAIYYMTFVNQPTKAQL